MAISRQRRNVGYGVGQPLFNFSPEPISSTRVPTTGDIAELGTVWTNKSTNAAWVLASVVGNSATWTPMTVNAGATITTGNLTVTAGDIIATAGDITASAGDIISTAGSVAAGVDVLAARSVLVGGDDGTGTAGSTTLTNVTDTTLSTGAGVVLMKTANPGDSSGWMKIYVGTDVRYIPYWTNLSP